jgi:hypothetical protein
MCVARYRSSAHINQKVNNRQDNPTAKIAALLFCILIVVIVVPLEKKNPLQDATLLNF